MKNRQKHEEPTFVWLRAETVFPKQTNYGDQNWSALSEYWQFYDYFPKLLQSWNSICNFQLDKMFKNFRCKLC